MAGVPDKMRALVFDKPTQDVSDLHVIEDKTVPKLGSELALPSELKQVLVKVECAALNPVDVIVLQMGLMVEKWPFVLGGDFSGTIAEVSEGSKWKVGQKVWGFSGVGKAAGGTLAEYCAVPEWMVAPVPDNADMQGASTLGTAGMAAAAALWQSRSGHHSQSQHKVGVQYLGLERGYDSRHESTPVLVYGASSSVGGFAVQLLKLAGYRIIAVASKKNHDYLTKLGATQLFDYHDSDYKDQIAKDPKNHGLKAAVDSIGMDTAGECFDTFEKCGTAPEQGMVATVRQKEMHQNETLKNKPDSELVAVTELFNIYDPSRGFLRDYIETLGKLLAEGKLIPSNVTVCNGLEGAKDGMQKPVDGKTQLEKLVVCV